MGAALWKRESWNIWKTFICGTDSKGNDKFSIGSIIETLFNSYIIPNCKVEEAFDFKYMLMCLLIERLSYDYKTPFPRKFSTTSHRESVINGVSGCAKAFPDAKVMSLRRDQVVVKVDSAFHNSKVHQMSTRNFWELFSGKVNCLLVVALWPWGSWIPSTKRGHKNFKK